ncbi:MAG: acyl carrier protein [Paludibacteraceae bacterium]|nr:acyl carrier protein [Paludibacteraceae bacterium]
MKSELRIEYDGLTPDTELRRDIGISSVDALAIAAFMQKTLGCKIIVNNLKAIVTLGDLYDYIEKTTSK